MEKTEFKFRNDIQGLRALAILLVVAAHIELPFFSGGFIGVDVFFVISGFLISGLILNEINITESVNLKQFYANRFRRLLPPLLLVWVVTIVTAIIFLSPINQLDQINAAKLTPLWLTNFYFSNWNIDYFGSQAESNLFLHTWSLGVEEQFYLFWPSLILFLLGAWRWQKDRRDIKSLGKSLATILVAGYLFSLFLSIVQPKFAFYSVFSRIWQFASGGLVYVLFNSFAVDMLESNRKLNNYANIFANLGILGIFISALVINGKQIYPGYWSLLPTFSTCLVLASCSVSGSKIPFLIRNPLFQFLGKISYAWYLWHWPVLIIGGLLIVHNGFFTSAMLMLVALFLAYLTFQYLEKPMRSSRVSKNQPILVIVLSIILMALAFTGASYWGINAKLWSEQQSQQRYSQVRLDVPEIYQLGCDSWFYSSELVPCVIGNPASKKTVVLLADSIGAQWVSAVNYSFPKDQWKVVVLTKSSCPIVDEMFFYERIGRQFIECDIWRRKAIDWIVMQSPDIVIVGSATYNFTKDQWINGSARIFEKISMAANQVFVLAPIPNLPIDGPTCLASRDWKPEWAESADECVFKLENDLTKVNIASWLALAAKDYSNIRIINADEIVCPKTICQAEMDKIIVFRDNQHLTDTFVRSKSKQFSALLNLDHEILGDRIE